MRIEDLVEKLAKIDDLNEGPPFARVELYSDGTVEFAVPNHDTYATFDTVSKFVNYLYTEYDHYFLKESK